MAVNDITQTISSIPQAGKRGVDVQTIFVNKQESFQDALTDVFVGQINTLRTQLNTFAGQVNTTATQVNNDATSASTSASTATTKASEASASASEALTSRNQAETFKNSASTSATTATTKASEASASATSASTSATTATTKASEASASATTATTKASEASASATTATTKASEASASATSASTSATTATTKASEASASATSASTSASQALTSRNQAETFAQQAQASASSVDANNIVHRTGNETIAGVKTFSSSPIVPIPTENNQIASKEYVDSTVTGRGLGAYGLRWNQETDEYVLLGATNRTQIQRNMRRCVLKDDGTVNYYLDSTNSTLKANGTASVLTGADGNVMVEVPKFWYKHSLNGDVHEWWVSDVALTGYTVHPWFLEGGVEVPFRYYRAYTCTNVSGKLMSISGSTPTVNQTRATFRTQANANGTGWSLVSWNGVSAIQLLYLTEYGNFNTQMALGRGNDVGGDYGITTGQSNSIGNASSTSINNDMWMSYRGIENWYADCWEFIDGINIQNYKVFLSNTPASFADDTYTGSYTDSGVTLPIMGGSYIKKISGNFIPTATGGGSSTFITDGGWSSSSGTLVIFGGAASSGLVAGGFAFVANSSAGSLSVYRSAGLSR